LINDLHQADTALSDNSIQTMAELVLVLLRSAAMNEYFWLLPICHGFPARLVTYYLKWREGRQITLRIKPSDFALCELAPIAMTA
jgi:hypothetical protein